MFAARSVVIGRLSSLKRAVQPASQYAWITSSANRRQTRLIVESRIEPDIDVPQHSLVDFVWKDLCVWEDKPCITCAVTGDTLRYGEARRLIHAFARFFIGTLNLEKGDVVSLIGFNSPLYAIVLEALFEAGLVISFVNPIYTNDEILYHLQKSNAKVIIADPEILANIRPTVKQHLPHIRVTLPLDDSLRPLAAKAAATEGINLPRINPEDLAAIPFSSGTSGLPKGVMLTNANVTSNMRMFVRPAFRCARHTSGDVQDTFFNLLPLFHMYGLQVAWHFSIMTGQHLLVMPKFTPAAYISTLRKYRPAGLAVVPTIIHMMVTQPSITREDLASINFIYTGAAACSGAYMDALQEKAGHPIDIRQGYGLTETSPVCMCNPAIRPPGKGESIGQVLPGCRARIQDLQTGEDCGPGQLGEILLKGHHVMPGYLGDEKATAEAIDSDGWFHTGDVGYYDEDEFFFIRDRTKDLIKVKALQVSPSELESIIMELPEIADVAVVGVPDDRSGELPRAFIAPKPGKTIDPNAVIAHVKPRVAPHKQLAGGVKVIESIPRNPTGKILRRELRKLP